MIIWPAKDPAEVLDYTWTVPLDTGDTVASYTVALTTGTAVLDSDSNTTTMVVAWVSGGTDGETSTFTLTATTTGGRTYREIAALPVFDRASEMLAFFRLRYPAFASIADGQIGYWLASATLQVGDNWPTAGQSDARLALAAHNAAIATASIPAGVTSFKSGTFSATLSDAAASRTGYSATVYGREYLDLVRRHFSGPFSAWSVPTNV